MRFKTVCIVVSALLVLMTISLLPTNASAQISNIEAIGKAYDWGFRVDLQWESEGYGEIDINLFLIMV